MFMVWKNNDTCSRNETI